MARVFQNRVLIVDDEEATLALTEAILKQEGYLTETARDGFEALAILRGPVPEVLISDLKMPNMSGFELLAVVRKRFPGIGVIARSAEFIPLGMREGVLADRFLSKGENDAFELLEMVREYSPVRCVPSRRSPIALPRGCLAPPLAMLLSPALVVCARFRFETVTPNLAR